MIASTRGLTDTEYLILINQIYVGRYAWERYRTVTNKYGETITQGMGLSGIIKKIVQHRVSGDFIVELDAPGVYKHCPFKYITLTEILNDCIITITDESGADFEAVKDAADGYTSQRKSLIEIRNDLIIELSDILHNEQPAAEAQQTLTKILAINASIKQLEDLIVITRIQQSKQR